MPPVTVVYATDANYWPHIYVSLYSLLKNNPHRRWRVLVICDREDRTFASRVPLLRQFSHLEGLENIVAGRIEDAPPYQHLTEASYYRLMVGRLAPAEVATLLYIDADTVIVDRLDDLLAIDLDGYLLAATENTWKQDHHRARMSVRAYFNAGVMLINLRRWREIDAGQRAFAYLREHRDSIRWGDQDALNGAFAGEWLPFPARFNDQLDRPSERPAIIHYAGGVKPWDQPFRPSAYWDYRQETPYAANRMTLSLLWMRAAAGQLRDRASRRLLSPLRRLRRPRTATRTGPPA